MMPVVILELVLLLMDCKYNNDIIVIDKLGITPLWELKWEGLPALERVI